MPVSRLFAGLLVAVALGACCAPQAAQTGAETAFVAVVTASASDAIVVRSDGGHRLELTLPPGAAPPAVGATIYVRGRFDGPGTVRAASLAQVPTANAATAAVPVGTDAGR